ncbi:MAG: hypothetical protein PHF67_05645, partial [Candidatus Nanoarchaeia archaeon]|nr:hypothetical protein [Candidatus Nanoarchaeia archaeon]
MGKEVVSNASSIIFIGKLKLFNLVKNLYSRVFLPEEVVQEIFKYGNPENSLIKEEIISGFIKEAKVKEIKEFPLHAGE